MSTSFFRNHLASLGFLKVTVAVNESPVHSVLANEIYSGETLNRSDNSAFVVFAGIERNRKGDVAILRVHTIPR